MLIYQLLRPLTGYLSVQHPTKRVVDWIIPCTLSLVASLALMYFREKINVYGSGGFVSLVLGYVQNLPGFYIAALAAIATFTRPEIDQIIPGRDTPKIKNIDSHGNVNLIELTRRRFLCLMFAFLTAECILLTLFSVIALNTAGPLRESLSNPAYLTLYFFASLGYFLLFFQLMVTTFWGIYYLGEKIHQTP